MDGEVVQHIEYVPFGKVFIEQRNNTWNTPYLFNAKELDEETGLYYYGARYYDPRTSVWISTDPLQEKYPNISTYAYCFQNPVKYIDPTGMEGEPGDGSPQSTNPSNPQNQLGRNPTHTIKMIFTNLELLTNFKKNFSKFTKGTYDADATITGLVNKPGYASDSKERADADNHWVNSKGVFFMDDYSISTFEYANYLLGCLIYGVGYENIVFPTNGSISSSLKNAGFVNDALTGFYAQNKGRDLYLSPFSDEINGTTFGNNFSSIFKNGFTHPETFIGSAAVFVNQCSESELLVTVFNITSITSGDFFKHGRDVYPRSVVRYPDTKQGDTRNEYGNVSQTYSFTIPIDRNRVKLGK